MSMTAVVENFVPNLRLPFNVFFAFVILSNSLSFGTYFCWWNLIRDHGGDVDNKDNAMMLTQKKTSLVGSCTTCHTNGAADFGNLVLSLQEMVHWFRVQRSAKLAAAPAILWFCSHLSKPKPALGLSQKGWALKDCELVVQILLFAWDTSLSRLLMRFLIFAT